MNKVEGKIFVACKEDCTPKTLLDVEQYLNNELAVMVYRAFGVSVRVHLSTTQEEV